VRNLPRVFMPCAQPRLEPTTYWSQVRCSNDSATTPPNVGHHFKISYLRTAVILVEWLCMMGVFVVQLPDGIV